MGKGTRMVLDEESQWHTVHSTQTVDRGMRGGARMGIPSKDQWSTSVLFSKMGQPRPLFHLFSSFQIHSTILQQINEKNVHPVYCTGIQTHDLLT